MKEFKLFRILLATTVFTLVAAGLESVAKELRVLELNCASLGRMRIKEATPNDDPRSLFSDFLVLTLPNGYKVNLVSQIGANVRNWTSPSSGITFSEAPTWSHERLYLERDTHGYNKGIYKCNLE